MHRTSWAWMSGAIVALKIMASLFKTTCKNRKIKASKESIIVPWLWGRYLWDYEKGVWNSWLHEERSERLKSKLRSDYTAASSAFQRAVEMSFVWEAVKGLERANRHEQFNAAPQSEQNTCWDVSSYWALHTDLCGVLVTQVPIVMFLLQLAFIVVSKLCCEIDLISGPVYSLY